MPVSNFIICRISREKKKDRDSMLRRMLKKIFQIVGINPSDLIQKISKWSVSHSVRENKFVELIERLRQIAPDISRQELTAMSGFNDYWELKRRALQAFQCAMMLKSLEPLTVKNLTVVDIGDSAGTHMLYLKELTKEKFDIDTIGVNLDSAAIEKLRQKVRKPCCVERKIWIWAIKKLIFSRPFRWSSIYIIRQFFSTVSEEIAMQ